tara:strand:- start:361 stop:867 length:507 start_codon:yes stop_codon:yes gene_type:complete
MKRILLALLVSLGLQTQAQMNVCDSLTYETFPNTTLTVTGNSNGLANTVGSVDWYFTACNSVACYTPQGNNPYSFPPINITDTVKLCYDAYVYALDSTMTVCNHCDSLIYDFNLFAWILFNTSNPTFVIEEEGVRWYSYKMYDLFGKELNEAPIGKMYIKNRKLLITF